MSTPRVAVNLPVFNGAASIRRQLDSIVAQTFGDFRAIITDNASTDETEQICREYVARDPRFQYHRNHRNLGADFSYRRGLMLCFDCDYMVYASHSDYWAPEYLERCVKALDADPKAALAYSHCMFFNGQDDGQFHLYKDDFVIDSSVDAPTRYLTILAQLGMCTPYYGLIRTRAYAEVEWVFKLPFAATDNAVLAALALWGSFIQIDRPLFFREAPGYRDASYEERQKRILDMAGGEVKMQTSMLTLPFMLHIISHCGIVDNLVKDLASKNELIGQTIRILLQRYGSQLNAELERSLELMAAGRFHTSMGESASSAPSPGQHPLYDRYILMLAASYYNIAYGLAPLTKGLNHGRASVALLLGRKEEALPLVEKELELNPTHVPSLDLRSKLKRMAG